MIRGLVFALALALAGPAAAHGIKVFASAGAGELTGYAFFIGGGRAQGTPWVATGPDGAELGRGVTDTEGAFALPVSGTGAVTVTVDTGEGHVGAATVTLAGAGGDGAVLAAIGRLEGRIAEMEARLRFTDMLSGVFLILGLAGMALWAKGRRK